MSDAAHASAVADAGEPVAGRGGSWAPPLLLAAVTLAVLLPFVAKPFHMDDPMYLWAARQIRAEPLDPYGFDVNWYGTRQPMAMVMKNPPGVSYYLAGASLLLGWGEAAMHGALLLPAVGAVLGTYRVGREFGLRSWHAAVAALAALLSPAFLVSSTTVMSDVAMLCGYVWAIAFWLAALRARRAAHLVVACLLIAVATLTKYFGVTLFPLLVAYALFKAPRDWQWWAPPLLIPIAILIAYQLWTQNLYGRGMLSDAASHATATRQQSGRPVLPPLVAGLSFAGGGCLTAALLMAASARRRTWVVAAIGFLAIAVFLVLAEPFPTFALKSPDGVRTSYLLQFALFVTAGVALLAIVVIVAVRDRCDADTLLLALWVLGTFAFAAVFNWSVNGRSVLAMAPPLAILAARRAAERGLFANPGGRRAIVAALVIGGALSVFVTLADDAHARAVRRSAYALRDRYHDRARFYFHGHWGFQYYMEDWGAIAYDPLNSQPQVGELFAEGRNQSGARIDGPPGTFPVVDVVEFPTLPFLATMDMSVRAGFYSDIWGPLPYAFGRVPPDQYRVREIRGPLFQVP